MNICIIPARGGSKRIRGKNIKLFLGKPIIAFSIENAIRSECFDRIIVSTDDNDIAAIAKEFGAEVPFIRPAELSDDFTGVHDVVDHALVWLQNIGFHYKYACTLYATAPLLKKEYLIEGLEKLENSNAKYSFSATSMPFPIQRAFKLDEDGRCKMFTPEYYSSRSQDLVESYQDAGQFYWTDNEKKSSEIMFGKDSIPIILPRYLVQDIDTMEDWKQAEYMYQALKNT